MTVTATRTLAPMLDECRKFGVALVLANELGHGTTPEELRGLPLFHALSRLLVDGQATPVFTLRTIVG